MSEKDTRDAFEQTSRAFRQCFNTPAGQQVLIFLADFCRAEETCVAIPSKNAPVDIYRTFILEGRREAFLQIQKFLNLTPEQLFLLATGRAYSHGEPNDE